MTNKSVPEMLRELAELYEERNKVYGNNYKRFGSIMVEMFPDGMVLKGAGDFNRAALLFHVIDKLTRYTNNWPRGHEDSLKDMPVYAVMLWELHQEEVK